LESFLPRFRPYDGHWRCAWDDVDDFGRTPDSGAGSRRRVEKRLLHRGVIEAQRADC